MKLFLYYMNMSFFKKIFIGEWIFTLNTSLKRFLLFIDGIKHPSDHFFQRSLLKASDDFTLCENQMKGVFKTQILPKHHIVQP